MSSYFHWHDLIIYYHFYPLVVLSLLGTQHWAKNLHFLWGSLSLNGFHILRAICLGMCGEGLSTTFWISLWGRPSRLYKLFCMCPTLWHLAVGRNNEIGDDYVDHICNKLNLFFLSDYSPSVYLLTTVLLLGLTPASLGHSKQLFPCLGKVQKLSLNLMIARQANNVHH